MSDTRVRAAHTADRAELVRMRMALWPDSGSQEVDALLARPATDGTVLVAEQGARVAGFAEVGLRPYAEGCRSSPVAYLEGIWVDEDGRRAGLGTALVEAALRWARSRGLTELASDCDVDNLASLGFHLAAGFEEAQRIVCLRQTVPDAHGSA